MKKNFVWATALAIGTLASVAFASPALAAPAAGTPIQTIGGYNFVSTSADGNITAAYSGTTGLSVYNASTQMVSNYTDTSLGMTSVGEAVVSPDGSEIYILGDNPQVVAVFDVAGESVTRTISIPFSAWMGAITPDGSTLIVYAKNSQDLVKIALATDTVSAPLDLGLDYPYQLCITSDSSTLYVPGYDAGYTSIVDIGTFAETGQLADDGGPLSCALGADDTLYIGDYDIGAIRTYTPDGKSLLSAEGLVDEMYGIGLTCGSVIIGDYQNTGYVTLDRATLSQVGFIDSPVYTYMMSVTADAKTTWVGGYAYDSGLQSITEDNCPVAALPDTGANSTVIGTSIAVSTGLLVAGVMALIVVRRRNARMA
jgi:LPXTG-motif cell wall-anchored protein